VGIFREGEDFHDDHGLGRLVEFRFKAPPDTTSSSITTHTPLGHRNCASWASQPQVGYTPAMPRREDHEVHKGHVVALGGKKEKRILKLATFLAEICGSLLYTQINFNIHICIYLCCYFIYSNKAQIMDRIM